MSAGAPTATRPRPAGSRARRLWVPALLLHLPSLVLLAVLAAAVGLLAYRGLVATSGQIGAAAAVRAGAVDGFFWTAMLRTLLVSLASAALACVMSVVVVEALLALDRRWVTVVVSGALFSPLIVSMTVRGYGWLLVLDQGAVSGAVRVLGELTGPIGGTAAIVATVIVMAHAMMPLTAFPVLARMREIQRQRIADAARDLGLGPASVALRVTAPLAAPTILRVGALAFGIAMGAFGIPAIIGRGRVQVVSELVYQNLLVVDWSTAFVRLAALLAVTGVVVGILFAIAGRLGRRMSMAQVS